MKDQTYNSKNSLNEGKKVIGTQVSLSIYQKVKEDADSNFMSVSDLLRKIIYLYYKSNKD